MTPSPRPRTGPERLGWALGAALIGGLFVYVSAVGFASVPPRLFDPPTTAWPPATECTEGLEQLRRDLAAIASDAVHGALTGDAASHASRLERWDAAVAGLSPRCTEDSSREGLHHLGVVRHRLEAKLVRIAEDDAPLLANLPRATARPGTAPEVSTP